MSREAGYARLLALVIVIGALVSFRLALQLSGSLGAAAVSLGGLAQVLTSGGSSPAPEQTRSSARFAFSASPVASSRS